MEILSSDNKFSVVGVIVEEVKYLIRSAMDTSFVIFFHLGISENPLMHNEYWVGLWCLVTTRLSWFCKDISA